MSDGAISQDEIDALLSGVAVDGIGGGGGSASVATASSIDVSLLQTFAEDLSSSLASNLSTMTGGEFTSGSAVAEMTDRDGFMAKIPDNVVSTIADFASGLSGDHLYVISPEFAQKIVNLVNKEESAELDDMAMSIISEAVSTHTNDEITTLERTGKISGISCNPPESMNNPKAMVRMPQEQFALFSYPVTVDGQEYTLWEAIGASSAEQICRALGNDNSSGISAADMAALGAPVGQNMQSAGMGMGVSMGSMGGMQMGGMMGGAPMNMPNVQSLSYPPLQGAGMTGEQGNISLIMDVFMEMTVELGRTKKQIKDILGMGEGTIIELDKLAGEPVDILVNHKPIAKGEVVVIDENFGVRVTEILSPLERVSDLH